MTDRVPPPVPPTPAYPPVQHPPRGLQPALPRRMPKPPLSVRQIWLSLIAGGLSFPLISAGVTQLIVMVVGGTGTLLLGGALHLAAGTTGQFGGLADGIITQMFGSLWLCIVLLWLGIGVSALFLRLGRVERMMLVTGAGLGAAAVVWQAAAGIFLTLWFKTLPSMYSFESEPDPHAQAAQVMIIFGAILTNILIGALSWWLMAHIFRRPQPAPPQ